MEIKILLSNTVLSLISETCSIASGINLVICFLFQLKRIVDQNQNYGQVSQASRQPNTKEAKRMKKLSAKSEPNLSFGVSNLRSLIFRNQDLNLILLDRRITFQLTSSD